jgi:hypothetical protein
MAKKKIDINKQVPIKWYIPDNIITRFASNMVVQTIENEFKISFFEIKPEIRFDTSTPPPSEVQAECVATVIITADRLPKFIEVLQGQLNLYNSAKSANK